MWTTTVLLGLVVVPSMFVVNSLHLACSVLRQLCAPAESTLMSRAFPLFLRQHVLLFHVLPDMRRQGLATLFVYVLVFLLPASAAVDGCQAAEG